jgi:hypothetical protein
MSFYRRVLEWMDSATVHDWTEVGTAIGTLGLAIAAIWALKDWKKRLENERADDCAGAAVDFSAAIGRYRAAKEAGSASGPVLYDQMWDARTRLYVAVCRARRYYPDLWKISIQTIDDKLRDLRNSSLSPDNAKNIHAEIIELLKPVDDMPPVKKKQK